MITVKINTVDVTSSIVQSSVVVSQKITHQVDSATFKVRKAGSRTLDPTYGDEIEILDGTTKVFAGTVISVKTEPISPASGVEINVRCVDHTYTMDKILASKTYEDQTIEYIIDDLLTSYAPGFTSVNVNSTFLIEKIVFNQIPISTCLKRLADLLSYDWYIDEDKDVHFFSKYTNSAPFSIDDTSGNHIPGSLMRTLDGSGVINRVKVRGGEYNGTSFTDRTTVSGSETKSFKLPYRFANLTIILDPDGAATAQTVGIDFIDDFTSKDVLYNYQEQTIRWETALTDGDVIEFAGNPKVPVFAISEDSASIASYGAIEQLVRDNSIESNAIARRRATAELFKHSEPIIDVKFKTYTSGLRAGQVINIDSTIRGISDELIIRSLRMRARDHESFMYEIDLISTSRFDFITLMQKVLEPDPKLSDEQETSEEIFTDTQEISIIEEYETVSSQEDFQTITISENYSVDPLGDETNADYVLAAYSPTGQTDTKRVGRLGISLVAY